MSTDVLILGAGLSGLHTAAALQAAGTEFVLAEARSRLGGRILSKRLDGASRNDAAYDLGPAWFWPGQRRMEDLVRSLGLAGEVVDQFGDGDAVFEDPAGHLRRGLFGAAMLGSYRLRGGMGQLIDALASTVPDDRVHCGWRAVGVQTDGDEYLWTRFQTADGEGLIRSRQVVVALPPRIAESSLELQPEASGPLRQTLRRTATWMAGQGKFVAVYEQPFWRHDGLSGDVISHRGPLGEVHDISPPADDDGKVSAGALFGFFAWPPHLRSDDKDELRQLCEQQLVRCFGPQAARPRQSWLKDWAKDERTATADDRQGLAPHADHTMVLPKDDPWSQRLMWSGSETADAAQRHNGYLEGALEASERTLRRLQELGE